MPEIDASELLIILDALREYQNQENTRQRLSLGERNRLNNLIVEFQLIRDQMFANP